MTLPLVQTTPPTLTPPTAKERAGAAVRLWIELFDRHQILTNASAMRRPRADEDACRADRR